MKRDFLRLLKKGWVAIMVCTGKPGVRLPDSTCGAAIIKLVYGHGMPKPITDMKVNDEGIAATLSFDNEPFLTFIPWDAVEVIEEYEDKNDPKPKLRLVN